MSRATNRLGAHLLLDARCLHVVEQLSTLDIDSVQNPPRRPKANEADKGERNRVHRPNCGMAGYLVARQLDLCTPTPLGRRRDSATAEGWPSRLDLLIFNPVSCSSLITLLTGAQMTLP